MTQMGTRAKSKKPKKESRAQNALPAVKSTTRKKSTTAGKSSSGGGQPSRKTGKKKNTISPFPQVTVAPGLKKQVR